MQLCNGLKVLQCRDGNLACSTVFEADQRFASQGWKHYVAFTTKIRHRTRTAMPRKTMHCTSSDYYLQSYPVRAYKLIVSYSSHQQKANGSVARTHVKNLGHPLRYVQTCKLCCDCVVVTAGQLESGLALGAKDLRVERSIPGFHAISTESFLLFLPSFLCGEGEVRGWCAAVLVGSVAMHHIEVDPEGCLYF